jgi:hypothetical protein
MIILLSSIFALPTSPSFIFNQRPEIPQSPTIFRPVFLAQSLQARFNRLNHIFALVAAGIGYA